MKSPKLFIAEVLINKGSNFHLMIVLANSSKS